MTKTEKRIAELEARLATAESEIKLLQRLMPEYRAWKFRQGREQRKTRRILASVPVCSQNPILSKITLCIGHSRRKPKSSRESFKLGDESQTGQASLGAVGPREQNVRSRGLLIANVVQNGSSVSHIADIPGRAPNNALTCDGLLRRVAPRVPVMKAAPTRHGDHRRVR